jgi:hypothetical protein
MANKVNVGRYGSPKYIEPIRKKFEEAFPNTVPTDFIIDHCLKYFWQHVEEQLKNEEEVQIFAYGTFFVKSGISERTKKFQYYPKFKFSRHFVLRLRDAKGTTTEAEQREIQKKQEFMASIWEKRKDYMIRTRGKIPQRILDIQEDLNKIKELQEKNEGN